MISQIYFYICLPVNIFLNYYFITLSNMGMKGAGLSLSFTFFLIFGI